MLAGTRRCRSIVQTEDRHRGDVGDLLAAALEHGRVGVLDVEQDGIEAFVAEAPQRIAHADHRYDLRGRHVVGQRADQPWQIAGLLPDQQEANRLLITWSRSGPNRKIGRRTARRLLPGGRLKHGWSPSPVASEMARTTPFYQPPV